MVCPTWSCYYSDTSIVVDVVSAFDNVSNFGMHISCFLVLSFKYVWFGVVLFNLVGISRNLSRDCDFVAISRDFEWIFDILCDFVWLCAILVGVFLGLSCDFGGFVIFLWDFVTLWNLLSVFFTDFVWLRVSYARMVYSSRWSVRTFLCKLYDTGVAIHNTTPRHVRGTRLRWTGDWQGCVSVVQSYH